MAGPFIVFGIADKNADSHGHETLIRLPDMPVDGPGNCSARAELHFTLGD
ncbi:MAG: hypothetical protein HQK54_05490 [Oligoflexales bacterium]|nr:hypothetical protein [Oligoflexales bacterium]